MWMAACSLLLSYANRSQYCESRATCGMATQALTILPRAGSIKEDRIRLLPESYALQALTAMVRRSGHSCNSQHSVRSLGHGSAFSPVMQWYALFLPALAETFHRVFFARSPFCSGGDKVAICLASSSPANISLCSIWQGG